jgi:hypothetical protein
MPDTTAAENVAAAVAKEKTGAVIPWLLIASLVM